MILATIHILMAIFISILSVVLIRIQKTMPSCQRNTCRSSNPRESNGRPRDSQIKDKKLKNQNGFQKAADSDAFWNGNDYGGTINSDSRKSVVNGQSPDRQFLLQQSLSPKTTFVESVHKNGCGGETLSLRRNVVVFNDEADVYHGYSAGRRFSELSQQYPTKSYVDAGGFVGFPPGPVVWNEHNGKDHQKEVRLAFLDGTVDSRPPATVRSFQSSRTTAGPPIAQFAYNNNNNGKESAELAAGDFENLDEFLDIQSISTSLQETNDSNKTTQSNQSVPSPSPYPHPLVSVV
jgi:hypothetical protein